MKSTTSEHDFVQSFADCGRADQFSYDARKALFEYLEQYEEDCGIEIELDPIGVCCEYSEHDSALDCISDNGYGFEPEGDDDDEKEESALEYLHENTNVIVFGSGIVIQGF